MVGIILASHGGFADGIYQSGEMIFGKQENVAHVILKPDEGPDDVRAKMEKAIESFDSQDEVLFLVDLWGGTPFNQANNLVEQHKDKWAIVAGMNLPMVIEAYASRSAIEKRIEGALRKGRHSAILDYMEPGKAITSSMIEKSIEREDELVTQCVTEASEYLSGGIASIINFINPKLIVLGGGLIEAVDFFYRNTIKKARSKSLPVPATKIEFKKAALGDFSGVIGAAFLEERDY